MEYTVRQAEVDYDKIHGVGAFRIMMFELVDPFAWKDEFRWNSPDQETN
jgi:hypothetical protein